MSTSDSDTDPFPPTPAAAPPPNNNHLLTPPTHEPPLLLTWEQLLDRFTHQVHRLSTEQTTSHRRLESALLSQLSAIKRDLSRQLSREVSGLRSQLLLADQPPKFSLFRRLPVEVRVRVWEFALWACPRVLEIRAGYLPRGGKVVGGWRSYHGVFDRGGGGGGNNNWVEGDGDGFGRDWRPAAAAAGRGGGGGGRLLGWMTGGGGGGVRGGGEGNNSNPLPGPVVTTNLLPPPALAGVCHESRVVALRYGGLCRTKVVGEVSGSSSGLLGSSSSSGGVVGCPMGGGSSRPSSGGWQGGSGNRAYVTAWTWFSPGVDYLKLPSVGPVYAATVQNNPGRRGGGGGDLLLQQLPPPLDIQHRAEQVLIRKPLDKQELERQVRRFQSGGLFTRLKTIGIIVTHDLVRPRSGGWEWGLGTSPFNQLFPTGEGPIRFVDLQSPSAALSIAHLFNESTPPHQVWTTHHASLLSKSPFASPLLNNTTFRLEGWEISWLIQRYKLFPLTFPLAEIVDTEDLLFYDGEVTRAENGWVREELRRMPEIRLLHAFILDEFNDEGGGYQGEKGVEVRRLYGGGFGGRLGTLGVV